MSKEKLKTSTKSRITKPTKKSLPAFGIPLENGLLPSSPSTGKSLQCQLDMNSMEDYELAAHVNVKGEWIPMSSTEFVDISEDLQGYDIATFIYEGEEKQSRICMRPL